MSHASRPCAPSNNLSISVQHARRVLHKMCISRTAPSAAHAERTCGVGLSELTARWNKRMKQPSAPPMKRQKVGREGERDREGEGGGAGGTKRETIIHTNRNKLKRKPRRSHSPLTCKRDCVSVSVGVCLCLRVGVGHVRQHSRGFADSTFLDFMTVLQAPLQISPERRPACLSPTHL